MTHRHRLSGQKLKLLQIRQNGSGLFEDGTGRVVCDMRLVEKDDEHSAMRGAPAPANVVDWLAWLKTFKLQAVG